MKDENHRRELSILRKNLSGAGSTIQRFEWQFMKSRTNTSRKANDTSSYNDVRRLEVKIRNLHAENEKLEEKLRVRKFFIKFLNLKIIYFIIEDIGISAIFQFIDKCEGFTLLY